MRNLTPLKAIRKNCLECPGFSPKEVTNCQEKDCPFWSFRFGRRPTEKVKLTPLKAIRKFCLGCAENPLEIRLCPTKNCSLYSLFGLDIIQPERE